MTRLDILNDFTNYINNQKASPEKRLEGFCLLLKLYEKEEYFNVETYLSYNSIKLDAETILQISLKCKEKCISTNTFFVKSTNTDNPFFFLYPKNIIQYVVDYHYNAGISVPNEMESVLFLIKKIAVSQNSNEYDWDTLVEAAETIKDLCKTIDYFSVYDYMKLKDYNLDLRYRQKIEDDCKKHCLKFDIFFVKIELHGILPKYLYHKQFIERMVKQNSGFYSKKQQNGN